MSLGAFCTGAILFGASILGWPAWAQRAQSPQPPKSLVAEEIRLVDPQGRPRAKITASPGEEGVTLALYHKDGKHMTLYRLNPTGLPSISLVPLP
jgi:hypothetical protein